MKKIVLKTCPVCLTKFNASANQIYCKRKCKDAQWNKNHQEYRKGRFYDSNGNFENQFERNKVFRKIQMNRIDLYEQKFQDILTTQQIKFHPQFIISPYIVDIFIPYKALIIEVDGPVHDEKHNQIKDSLREEYLSSFGLFIIRYTTHTKETIENFINNALKLYPDIKRKRFSTIRKRLSIINNISKIPDFKINTMKSYLDILYSYKKWKRIEKLKVKFPNWMKYKRETANEIMR